MKYKYSIITGMLSIFLGFIPISIKKPENINYVIYAKTLQQANHIAKVLEIKVLWFVPKVLLKTHIYLILFFHFHMITTTF